MQVATDGPRRQEQALTDLFVGQAGGREKRYLTFLRSERIHRSVSATWLGLTGGSKLISGPIRPRSGAQAFEGLESVADMET
jgi:hypothetical protein